MLTRPCLAALLSACMAAAAHAQPPTTSPSTPGALVLPTPSADLRGRLTPRPRLTDGKRFTFDLRAKFQGDYATFDPLVDPDDEGFVWRRRRLGVRGELFDRFSFEVEREFGDEEEPWRDVYANVRIADLLELRGGKFKAPFGLDNSTSSASHDFIFRSLGTRQLAPGREVGGMVHGGLSRGRFSYAVAAFDARTPTTTTDGFFDDDQGGESFDRTLSGRVTVQPFDGVEAWPRGLRNLEFGASAATSSLPTGRHGMKGRSVFGHEFFDRVYVSGDRRSLGVDVALTAGPASLEAEWTQASDERLGQGVGDVDLSKAFGRGWYVSGSWLVTGEDNDDTVVPRRPVFGGGFGAVEIAARFERMSFGSAADASAPASTNPRGENLARNHDDVVTVGLNWHVTRWVKVQVDAIHESFLDAARAPIAGTPTYWSYVTRLQLAF